MGLAVVYIRRPAQRKHAAKAVCGPRGEQGEKLSCSIRIIQLLRSLHPVDRIGFEEGFVRCGRGSARRAWERPSSGSGLSGVRQASSFQNDLPEELERKTAGNAGLQAVNREKGCGAAV